MRRLHLRRALRWRRNRGKRCGQQQWPEPPEMRASSVCFMHGQNQFWSRYSSASASAMSKMRRLFDARSNESKQETGEKVLKIGGRACKPESIMQKFGKSPKVFKLGITICHYMV